MGAGLTNALQGDPRKPSCPTPAARPVGCRSGARPTPSSRAGLIVPAPLAAGDLLQRQWPWERSGGGGGPRPSPACQFDFPDHHCICLNIVTDLICQLKFKMAILLFPIFCLFSPSGDMVSVRNSRSLHFPTTTGQSVVGSIFPLFQIRRDYMTTYDPFPRTEENANTRARGQKANPLPVFPRTKVDT